MGSKKNLLQLVDEFIEEKNASWNHEDWTSFVSKVKSEGIDLKEETLGNLLETRKEKYTAKIHGLKILSRSKLINL
ncbi:hypothetical protein JXC34_02975, partial [Candidatus Woesearchaeota archaeon]|nr:hypothetical protein [Candidatus Woesearchaeota archaeon]